MNAKLRKQCKQQDKSLPKELKQRSLMEIWKNKQSLQGEVC